MVWMRLAFSLNPYVRLFLMANTDWLSVWKGLALVDATPDN